MRVNRDGSDMSEPSSGVPREIVDAEVDEPAPEETPERVELDVDQDKLDAWDDVKNDYEVDPDGEPVPNSMDSGRPGSATDEDDELDD
jgi:hypothetical protein